MNSHKKIQKINSSKKIRGIRIVVFCSKCKRDLTEGICHKTKEDRCIYSETHHNLKYYLNVPDGGGKRAVRVLKGVKSIEEAQIIAMNHKLDLKNGRISQHTSLPVPVIHNTQQKEERPLLKDFLAQHLDALGNFQIAPHLQRTRSKDYLDDISRGYRYLLQGLKQGGHNINSYSVTDLNDAAVGLVHDYFLDKGGLDFSNRSYSKYMQYYSTFLDWCIEEHGIGKINYFKKVPKKITHYTPEIITKENFDKLIAKINYENGIQVTPDKEKTTRNVYKNWLAYALKISLETGRRRPEVVNLKWSDIHSQDLIPIYIKVADSKVNNIMNLEESKKKYVYVPITSGLSELIKDGYEEYQKTKIDGHVIAPEIKDKREKKMCDAMSRGFSHYYKLVNPNENEQLHYGCLRKTYLTSLEIHSKGQTALVSGHGSDGKIILHKHYIDPRAIASVSVSKGFSVFQDENSIRNEELAIIREKGNLIERNLEK